MTDEYIWTDNPTVSGIATCDTDVLNDCLMHLKYNGSSSRNIGEIVTSTIPLTDAGLHLLDGALLSGSGSYSAFVDYIADLYDSGDYTAIFDTEANWQAAVTLSGVCGKFVYDSTNNTVRLPLYSDKIYTKNFATTAGVKGNGMTLGLTNSQTNVGLSSSGSTAIYVSEAYGQSIGTPTVSGTSIQHSTGVTTDASKSGIIADLSNITTALDGYYYIVIATTTKTSIEVDIDEIATDLNGKMDVDGSNANASVKNFDGQFVFYNQKILNNVSITTTATDVDLTSILPNDNYSYLLLMYANGKPSSAGTGININGKDLNGNDLSNLGGRGAVAGTANSITAYAIVDTNRKISLKTPSNSWSEFSLYLTNYRRIGTNQ